MNIILGFGVTETDFEKQEFDFVEAFVKEKAVDEDFYFTEAFAKELEGKLKERADEYRRLDKKYKNATEYPDRYSTYYFTVLNDVASLCVVFKFSHINRRHAMSPDGWALLGTKKVYYADVWDFKH